MSSPSLSCFLLAATRDVRQTESHNISLNGLLTSEVQRQPLVSEPHLNISYWSITVYSIDYQPMGCYNRNPSGAAHSRWQQLTGRTTDT